MKIYIAHNNTDINAIGGGWSFVRNLIKTLKNKVDFVNLPSLCDICFVPSTTMATLNEVQLAKEHGAKIVVRVDGIPKNSRNTKPSGVPHFLHIVTLADEIIYQSEASKSFIKPFIRRDGEVILNGADTDIFKPEGEERQKDGSPQYLYSRYRRDEMKRWDKAWFDFQKEYFQNSEAHLWIVGRFSRELPKFNFDLFGGAEYNYKCLGAIESPEEMAKIYRSADVLLAPYFQDPCSNAIIEARLCGLKVDWDDEEGGGTNEIMSCSIEYLNIDRMGEDYLKVFNSIF